MKELPPLPPGRFTDPTRPVTFTFEGRTIPAIHGQSIAAALYATGVRIFSRSFKYHRPRGLLCMSGDCPNCLMLVDDRPNVRTCIEPVRLGQVVKGQNAWPSLNFDVLRIFDKLSAFLPVGFYYKRFYKPRWIWPIFEKIVRRIAGLGRIDVNHVPELETEVEHLHTEVCVIGGGPAGLAAATAAAEAGAEVVLLERMLELGGQTLLHPASSEEITRLVAGLRSGARSRLLTSTDAFGLYEGNVVAAANGNRLLRIRAGRIVVCTGDRERPFLFTNNDLPGVFLGRAILRLARLHGVLAGSKAVVVTDHPGGHELADQLAVLGIEVCGIVDRRGADQEVDSKFPVHSECVVIRADGASRLERVTIAKVGKDGTILAGSEQQLECDLLCMAAHPIRASELSLQAGQKALEDCDRIPHLAIGSQRTECTKCFVCLCEDVTPRDIQQSLAEGFDHVETLKRYATIGMGPCQGKVCGRTGAELFAAFTKSENGAVSTTTSRPPAIPVELAVVAAEKRHHPVRRTPMHHWHEANNARWMDAGQWKRPESYGDPTTEVQAVRNSVGLIDVSTLGKIEVIGPDAAELLERVYLGEWKNLGIGRARYGVMCTEEGIVFDDGVGARLGTEHFYLTATTGNAEAVFQWLELWRTTWRLHVTIINQTAALAAVNLAGPRAREVLSRLTSLDLSAAAFPYPAIREAEVAGVSCRLLRVGFVGELGYEIHCPSAYGLHLWEALLNAGHEVGIKPFGVEAQRILRLEKGHFIVGQDTDALSNPFGAGLGKMVRFNKPVFIGREPLVRLKEMGLRLRLVGFRLHESAKRQADNNWARQLEGRQVVEQGRSVGRVTSARFSPTLQKYIGLGWVPAAKAESGSRFAIRCGGSDLEATVAATPFYDPVGDRLKG